jgi:hypothetical protein
MLIIATSSWHQNSISKITYLDSIGIASLLDLRLYKGSIYMSSEPMSAFRQADRFWQLPGHTTPLFLDVKESDVVGRLKLNNSLIFSMGYHIKGTTLLEFGKKVNNLSFTLSPERHGENLTSEIAQKLIDEDWDGIITDRPDLYRKLIDPHQLDRF